MSVESMQHQKFSKKQSENSSLKNISDDIIVFGKGQEENNKNPCGILQRLKENNLRLNEDKCEFSKTEFKFYGHIYNYSGLKPDPRKVKPSTRQDLLRAIVK